MSHQQLRSYLEQLKLVEEKKIHFGMNAIYVARLCPVIDSLLDPPNFTVNLA